MVIFDKSWSCWVEQLALLLRLVLTVVGSFDRVVSPLLVLLLLDADVTDLPALDTVAADAVDVAAAAATAGVGVFFEKKEKRFFCLGVAMVVVPFAFHQWHQSNNEPMTGYGVVGGVGD